MRFRKGIIQLFLGLIYAAIQADLPGPSSAWAGPFGLPAHEVIAYLTDIEGDWRKVESFLANNPYVYLDRSEITRLRDGATLVFGGDAIDKGGSDLRVTRWLADLKRRYPDRVILLAGNRDTLKILLPQSLLSEDSPEKRLKWLLSNRLGAPDAFELRRQELSQSARLATDADVLRSYLGELSPGGNLRYYLENSQLIYVRGETLFLHGGVTLENLGQFPTSTGFERTGSVKQWAAKLNGWHQDIIQTWIRTGSYPESFIRYFGKLPGMNENPESIVYGRFSDEKGNPRLPPREVIEWLKSRGIRRIVVGHTPSGQVPALLREEGFEIIIADNSRSVNGSQLYLTKDHGVIRAHFETERGTHPIELRWRLADRSWLGRYVPGTSQLIKARDSHGRWVVSEIGQPDYQVRETLIEDSELQRRISAGRSRKCEVMFEELR